MKKCKEFTIQIQWHGIDQCSHVYMNGIEVYVTKDYRDCDMFVAELKIKIIINGGTVVSDKWKSIK